MGRRQLGLIRSIEPKRASLAGIRLSRRIPAPVCWRAAAAYHHALHGSHMAHCSRLGNWAALPTQPSPAAVMARCLAHARKCPAALTTARHKKAAR